MKTTLLLILSILAASTVLAESPRTWTSKDGSATMFATFNKVDGNNVVLILQNGRSQTVARDFLSEADLQWIDEQAAGSDSSSDSNFANSKIFSALKGKLVDGDGKSVDLAAEGPAPQYYLFYYSASWCGPCKAFTPDLVRFYKKMKNRGASLQVVLVPSDRSLEEEIAYLKDHRMPWPGVKFEDKSSRGIPQSKWGYIPALVLVDADGKRLAEVSDQKSKEDVLEETEDLLSGKTGETTM